MVFASEVAVGSVIAGLGAGLGEVEVCSGSSVVDLGMGVVTGGFRRPGRVFNSS